MDETVNRYTAIMLGPTERPTRAYSYFVTGRNEFPFDMLRYDRCWPRDGDDLSRIGDNHRSIRMASFSPPTIGRWSSFGWSVSDQAL